MQQWQDSTRWEWHAGAWWQWHADALWQWGQWGHGSAWRQLDSPAIPALEEQEEQELSRIAALQLGAPISAIRRSATIRALESGAQSDQSTPETAVAADEQQVFKRVRVEGIPEHQPQVKAASFKAPPAGFTARRGVPASKAPPQRVKTPLPGVGAMGAVGAVGAVVVPKAKRKNYQTQMLARVKAVGGGSTWQVRWSEYR